MLVVDSKIEIELAAEAAVLLVAENIAEIHTAVGVAVDIVDDFDSHCFSYLLEIR